MATEVAESKRIRPEPGIYYDVPFSEYQSWDAYNPSLVKVLINDSALAMHHTMESGSESSDSMKLGTAAHLMLYQPELFLSQYVVWDGGTRRGKLWDAFVEENADREILTQSEYDTCLDIRNAVRGHPRAAELLTPDGKTEVSIVWNDDATNALCKGRIDFLAEQHIVDMKTAADPKPFGFTSQAVKFLYHVSMGAYMSGLWSLGKQHENAHFIAVGNKPWHDVIRYDIGPQVIRRGIELWQYGLSRAIECEKTGRWPGCAPEPVQFELPDWAMGVKPELVTIGGEAIFEDEEV